MPALEDMYRLADEKGIVVYGFPLPESRAVSVMGTDGSCAIGIDSSRRYSTAEEKSMLIHELGHCSTGAFYNSASPLSLIGKCEKKADEWAILNMLPLDALVGAYRSGLCTSFELAEYFEVSEQLVNKAIEYYFESGEIYGTLGKDDKPRDGI